MNTISPEKAKYAAVVSNVKELRLIGEADLDFWNRYLADKPFQALNKNGSAEITVAATELVWKGFQFNELTIFLTVAERNEPEKEAGVFLIQAFNSNRFFAFCERIFFSTPYYFGQIGLRAAIPGSMSARTNNRNIFTAQMSKTERPFELEDEHWEGPIFLPQSNKYFVAKLSGQAKVCPFNETDKLEFNRDGFFNLLNEANFVGKEWRTRSDAFHAKSKTYSIENFNN